MTFKVGGKIFAITRFEGTISLKCEPDLAEQLRQTYPEIRPGYHLNKRHWNTIALDGSLADTMVRDLIEDSYALIVAALPSSRRPSRKPRRGGAARWAIQDSNLGPLPYQRSALTD